MIKNNFGLSTHIEIDRTQPALEVHQLAAGYAGDRRAIHDINFTVGAGERVAVIGPNGAGKSTLFKAIVGLIPFTMGHISIYGEDCHSSHNFVGYVPQQGDIDWSFPVSVYDVVMMGRARHIGWLRLARKKDRDIVHTILEQLSLTNVAHRQIGELSGGQKRRVFVARALAQETHVLLMDEPFTGVDKSAEQDIMDTLDILTKNGITMLLATHDMEKASTAFNKILLVNQEQLAYGSPSEVMQADILADAFGGGIRIFSDGQPMLMFTDTHGLEN
jgi:manganese/iron transport system ATP-binding protein